MYVQTEAQETEGGQVEELRRLAAHWMKVADEEATKSHDETRVIILRLRTENRRLKRLLSINGIPA